MSLSGKAFTVSAAISVTALFAACLVAGSWVLLPVPLAAAGALLLSRRPRLSRLVGVAFAVLLCGCGAGIVAGLAPLLMLAGSLAGIAAWDLDSIARAARGAADPGTAQRVEKAHVARLLGVLGAGAVLGVAALFLRHSLGLAALLCAGVVLAASLGALLRGLARSR